MPKVAKDKVEAEVLYPEVDVKIFDADSPLTAEVAMRLLKWENERAYAERVKALNPKAKDAQLKFGDDFLLKDVEGVKVRCWFNNHHEEVKPGVWKLTKTNRPFDEGWAWSLAQVILNKQFAPDGPNCETIVVSRTGMVQSGQHRLVGLILAWMLWNGWGKAGRAQKDHWREIWETEPTIQTLVAFGASDSPRSVMTLDNVKPRSAGDVFYTSEHFIKLGQAERQECSRMLAAAGSLFYKRTVNLDVVFDKALTNQSLVSLVERHPRMLRAVKTIFDNNVTRGLTSPQHRLSPGQCAAMLYLMGSSGTGGDRDSRTGQILSYLNADPAPCEKKLDWKAWDKAVKFWECFVDGEDAKLKPAREALRVLNEVPESKVSSKVKLAIIAQAWAAWSQGKKVTDEAVALQWVQNAKGETVLKEVPSVGGIDLGDPKEAAGTPEAPNEATAEDQEAEKKRIRDEQARRLIESRAKGNGKGGARGNGAAPKPPSPMQQELAAVREANPNIVVLFRSKSGGHNLYEEDVRTLAAVTGEAIKEPKAGSLLSRKVAADEHDAVLQALTAADYAVGEAAQVQGGGWRVELLNADAAEEDANAEEGEEFEIPKGDEEE